MGAPLAHTDASTAVIEAVANEEGVLPRGLSGPKLFDRIDGDALDTICQYDTVEVSFEFHGFLVTVDSENQVELTDAARI